MYKFYSCVNLKIVFQSTRCIKSFFPYKDRINRSQQSRVIYRANCWDCNGFYIGKTKRRLHDRKTEHFKALAKNDNTSAIADHVKATGHNIKWDHFDILAKGKTDYHCKIKETLYIQELEPAFNVNVGSEKLMLYQSVLFYFTVKYLLNLGSSPLTFVIYIYLKLWKPGRQTLTFCATFHNFPCLILAWLLCCSRLMPVFFVFFLACFLVRDMFSSGCRINYPPPPPAPYPSRSAPMLFVGGGWGGNP